MNKQILMFECLVPPTPHFIACGKSLYLPGQAHSSRRNIGVFDLLFVTNGSLFIGEDKQQWSIENGCGLLLRPDKFHYATRSCEEETHFYWLAFQIPGQWVEHPEEMLVIDKIPSDEERDLDMKFTEFYTLRLPRFFHTSYPQKLKNLFEKLIALNKKPQSSARWEQQQAFLSLIQVLQEQFEPPYDLSTQKVAERAAAYMREHYQSPISYQNLQKHLHYHPNYIARCMQRVFGCTLMEYLIRFRIERAKLELLHTEHQLHRIAEEVGFSSANYFTRCFVRQVGITPSQFRKRYRD